MVADTIIKVHISFSTADIAISSMQTKIYPQYHTKSLLTVLYFVLVFLSWSPFAVAEQIAPHTPPEIRYIDRSKGEINHAIPVIRSVPKKEAFTRYPAGTPLLWRIEQPDRLNNARSSYIFGTIHLDDEKVMAIPDSLLRRLAVADTLMLELELNDLGSVDVLRKMLFTDGRNLAQVIGETSFNEVSEALINTGNDLPDDVITFLKPWAAMLLLIRPENSTGTFLDKRLADLARNAGIRVQGLETVNEQLSVFDDIAMEDQVNLLQSAMSTLVDKDDAYKQLLDAYLGGDLEELVSIADTQLPKDRQLAELLNKKLILERNERMFIRMQTQLQAGNTFIAVGALHLPGQMGLLNKLNKAGYRLIRVEKDQ